MAGLIGVAINFKKGLMPDMYNYVETVIPSNGSIEIGNFKGFIIWQDLYSYSYWHLFYCDGSKSVINLSGLTTGYGKLMFENEKVVYRTTAQSPSNFKYYILRMP